jgi:WD40 repeat protein
MNIYTKSKFAIYPIIIISFLGIYLPVKQSGFISQKFDRQIIENKVENQNTPTPGFKAISAITPTNVNGIPIHNLALNETNIWAMSRQFTIKTGSQYCRYSNLLDTALDTRVINGQPFYYLATHDNKNVQIWSINTKKSIQNIQSGSINNIVFHPDNKSILTFSNDTGILSLWDINDRTVSNKFDLDNDRWHGNRLELNNDGSRIAIFSIPYNTESDFPISEFSLSEGKKADSNYFFPMFDFAAPPFVYSPSGSLIVVFNDQAGSFHLVNLSTQKDTLLQNPFSSPEDSFFTKWLLSTIAMDSSEKYIIGGSFDGDIYIWNIFDGSLIKSIKAHEPQSNDGWFGGIHYISFSPSSNLFVSVGFDDSIKLWDAKNGDLLREIYSCYKFGGFTQDGRYLVLTGKEGIEVWGISDYE